jgi:hypothetical protein
MSTKEKSEEPFCALNIIIDVSSLNLRDLEAEAKADQGSLQARLRPNKRKK